MINVSEHSSSPNPTGSVKILNDLKMTAFLRNLMLMDFSNVLTSSRIKMCVNFVNIFFLVVSYPPTSDL